MDTVNKDFFIKNKFTHIAFCDKSKNLNIPLTWNKLILDDGSFFEGRDKNSCCVVLDFQFDFLLSDQKILLDIEDKTKIFLLNSEGKIYYVNILSYHSKVLNRSNEYKFSVKLILDNLVHFCTIPFSFIFDKEYCFFSQYNNNLSYDYINQTILENENNSSLTQVDMFFISNKIKDFSSYIGIKNQQDKEKYADFKIKFTNGLKPQLIL